MKPTSTRPREARSAALRLSAFLPYRLSIAAAAASDGLARLYEARFGIGIPEWRVLATVGEFGSITAKAVGEHARMGKVKVSRAAASLEARGLIARQPNPEDRREAFLVLAPQGQAMYGEIAPLALAYADRLAEALTPEEAAQFDALIARLTRRADAMQASPPSPDEARSIS